MTNSVDEQTQIHLNQNFFEACGITKELFTNFLLAALADVIEDNRKKFEHANKKIRARKLNPKLLSIDFESSLAVVLFNHDPSVFGIESHEQFTADIVIFNDLIKGLELKVSFSDFKGKEYKGFYFSPKETKDLSKATKEFFNYIILVSCTSPKRANYEADGMRILSVRFGYIMSEWLRDEAGKKRTSLYAKYINILEKIIQENNMSSLTIKQKKLYLVITLKYIAIIVFAIMVGELSVQHKLDKACKDHQVFELHNSSYLITECSVKVRP